MLCFNKVINRVPLSLTAALIVGSTAAPNLVQSATLGQRAVYTVKILTWDDAASVGQCSAFTFGDVSTICGSGSPSVLKDNEVLTVPALTGGDGVAGDGLAGSITIETSKADGVGNLTFVVNAFQMDPYLETAGGVFKTTMSPPDGSLGGSGTIDAAGNMTLDVTGRVGVAQFFEGTIGIQPWNIDNAAAVQGNGDPTTGLYEGFTTGSTSNYDPSAGGINLTLTGRPIGDVNSDSILDAVLLSVGNVGAAWGGFDGTPYSEAFNVQFQLVSSKPVANPDTLGTTIDTALIIDEVTALLTNDNDADGDTLSVVSITPPTQAGSTVVDNGNGTVTYTPATGFNGIDTFTYTISDPGGSQDTATVSVNVSTSANTPPVANGLNVTTDEDTPLVVGPTSNDTDANGDTLTITTFDNPSAQGGSVVSNGNNTVTYTPAPNFNGADSFSYTISDGRGGTGSATVSITVNAVNDPVVCSDASLSTAIATPLSIDIATELLSTCTDADGDTITLSGTTQPTRAGSSLSFDGANTLTYTPAASLVGQDTFTYTATDGTATDTKTVAISVGKIFGNFTMLQVECKTFGGTNDIVADWDGTMNTSVTDTNFNMTMATDAAWPFFGFQWTAHDIRVFGPGSYSFDTTCSTTQVQAGVADCGGAPNQFLNLTVSPGKIGAHMLFDWNKTKNIDVVLHWDTDGTFTNPPGGDLYQGPNAPAGAPPLDAVFELVSRDVEGDGCPGARMIDGDFVGYRANFNLNFTKSSAGGGPVTAAPTSSSSPNLGSTGCTIAAYPVDRSTRGDLLVLAGFIAWLGIGVRRRQRRLRKN